MLYKYSISIGLKQMGLMSIPVYAFEAALQVTGYNVFCAMGTCNELADYGTQQSIGTGWEWRESFGPSDGPFN